LKKSEKITEKVGKTVSSVGRVVGEVSKKAIETVSKGVRKVGSFFEKKKGKNKKVTVKKQKGGAVCGDEITLPNMSESELAIQQKYGAQYNPIPSNQCGGRSSKINNSKLNQLGGDGYSVNPSAGIGLMPEIDRYSYGKVPVYCGELTQDMQACQSGGRLSKINSPDLTLLDGVMKNEMKKIFGNPTSKIDEKKMKILAKKLHQGGNMISMTIMELSNIIAPLGKNALISLIVLLGLGEMGKYSHVKKSQRGGSIMATLGSTLAPMGLNELLAIASLLILQHFVKKNTKHSDKSGKKGGAFLMELNTILAPLGVNVFGASLLLVFLNGFFQSYFEKKHHKKNDEMKGGFMNPMFSALSSTLVPLGWESFSAVVVLLLLNHLFRRSQKHEEKHKSSHSQKGGEMAMIISYIYQVLMPLGVNVFTTTTALTIASRMMSRPSHIKKSVKKLKNKL